MHRRIVKILVTVAVVAGGAGMLLYSSLGDAEYYQHVDELMETPEAWEGKNLRVHGFVEPGSVSEEVAGQRLEREFVLEHEGERIEVRHVGPAPDTFRELAEVVAMGTIVREDDGRFVLDATELTAKCPSKYEGESRTRELDGELGEDFASGDTMPAASEGVGSY